MQASAMLSASASSTVPVRGSVTITASAIASEPAVCPLGNVFAPMVARRTNNDANRCTARSFSTALGARAQGGRVGTIGSGANAPNSAASTMVQYRSASA